MAMSARDIADSTTICVSGPWRRLLRREGGPVKHKINTAKPHAARVYDFYLGGKDHFAADRETGQALMRVVPTIRAAARENRAFLGRAVRFLVAEAGIRQFLDIGTGLPSANNVHEVAQ